MKNVLDSSTCSVAPGECHHEFILFFDFGGGFEPSVWVEDSRVGEYGRVVMHVVDRHPYPCTSGKKSSIRESHATCGDQSWSPRCRRRGIAKAFLDNCGLREVKHLLAWISRGQIQGEATCGGSYLRGRVVFLIPNSLKRRLALAGQFSAQQVDARVSQVC